jgi:outer membrane protein W
MKTKTIKSVILLMAVYLFAKPAAAQFAYFHVGGGYGFPSSTQNIDGLSNYTQNSNSISAEQINLSFGKGINLNGAFGYMFTDYVGAELGVNYLMSSSWQSKQTYGSDFEEIKMDANMLRINPTVVLQGESSTITPYIKVGMLLGFGTIERVNTDKSTFGLLEDTYEYTGGMGIGFNAALGANFEIGDNMFLFGEFAFTNMSYGPSKGSLTKTTIDGKDMLSTYNTSEKEYQFLDNYSQKGAQNDNEPTKSLKNYYSFGSVGLNIGFKMTFN